MRTKSIKFALLPAEGSLGNLLEEKDAFASVTSFVLKELAQSRQSQ